MRSSLPTLRAILAVVAAAVIAATPLDAHAIDPWPGDSGTEIGNIGQAGGLPTGYEPSGAVWHAGLNQLLIVGDDGDVTKMDSDGTNQTTWTPGGDLEGITIIDPQGSIAYLGREHPDAILEFDLDTGLLTGNSWDLTTWMASSNNNQGLEALTYFDGRFYAGLQETGTIYIFELAGGGGVTFIGTIASPGGRTDISGLHYDDVTETLYAIYDGSDVIVEMMADGTFLREYTLAGDNQEGLALISSCPAGEATVFISEDSGDVQRYGGYPVSCPASEIPALPRGGLVLVGALVLLAMTRRGKLWPRRSVERYSGSAGASPSQ